MADDIDIDELIRWYDEHLAAKNCARKIPKFAT